MDGRHKAGQDEKREWAVIFFNGFARQLECFHCRLHDGQPPARYDLYGVTSQLPNRIWLHQEDLIPGFTKTYAVHRLVWYEPHENMVAAIQREKSIKKYKREWKINLIERENPYWDDLFPALVS